MDQKILADLSTAKNVSIDTTAVHPATGKSAKDIFCAGWPATKTVLEAIQAMTKNPIVKLVINVVISAGDGLQSQICV